VHSNFSLFYRVILFKSFVIYYIIWNEIEQWWMPIWGWKERMRKHFFFYVNPIFFIRILKLDLNKLLSTILEKPQRNWSKREAQRNLFFSNKVQSMIWLIFVKTEGKIKNFKIKTALWGFHFNIWRFWVLKSNIRQFLTPFLVWIRHIFEKILEIVVKNQLS
jgi:hypothetical protein